MTEYALLVTLIALVALGGIKLFGDSLAVIWNSLGAQIAALL